MNKETNEVKRNSEERLSVALRQLSQTLVRNLEDLAVVLDGYEVTHTVKEMEDSNEYGALVAGYFGINELIKDINKAINRERK
ncbi:MAG: hypothetical protein J1E16_09510 [Muribaculaceae bacterium]|nr:hypothetical protein [Muribaculaceae bacterium]